MSKKGYRVVRATFHPQPFVEQARNGDVDASRYVLESFAASPSNPVLASYVAECIKRWHASDFNRMRAPSAFNLAKRRGRRSSQHSSDLEERMIIAYIEARHDMPASKAKEHVEDRLHVSSASVARAVAGLENPSKSFTPMQSWAIATMCVDLEPRQARRLLGDTIWTKRARLQAERRVALMELAARVRASRGA